MDLSSNETKTSCPLFPAFNASSSKDIEPTPLFPAYVSEAHSTDDRSTDREWLCNSSYVLSNNEEVYFKQEEIHQIEVELKEKKVKISHHKKKKSKIQHIPYASSCDVPESESIRNFLNKKTFIGETGLSFERAYRVDSKCDPDNRHFECLEQKNIAKYKPYPRTPIGLTTDQLKLWPKPSSSNSKDIFLRYFSKKAMKLLKKEQVDSVEQRDLKMSNVSSDVTLNFIPLSQGFKEQGIIKNFSKEFYDGISLSWKLHSATKVQSVENIAEESPLESSFRNQTISFNKKLSEFPHDIELWLDFVNFQDELYFSNEGENANATYSETSVTEKKVAILDKALKHNPKSVCLNIAKLNLCRSLWKLDKLISCWDELIFLNPNNVDVWQEYFIFILTNLTYFTTPRILKLFAKCLRTMSDLSEGIIESHKASPDIIPKMIDIFSLMCFVLKSCGYMEKAVGAFQALIELNLFHEPGIETLPVSNQILFLEPFWDSGAARFGEDGAIGWQATVTEKKITFDKIVTQSDLSNFEDKILNDKLPQWKTWLQFEKLRELHHWLPWKPNPEYDQTDDDIDDMDRVVSFEDVSKFLFRVSNEDHKFLLLQKFIMFLGFNPHDFGCNISPQNIKRTYIEIDNFDIISKTLENTLFNKVFNPLCFETEICTKDRFDFVNNIFSQVIGKFSPKYKTLVSLMWLRFYQKFTLQSINKIDDAKKFAKSMLKEVENRNCLVLWFEFIKIESYSSITKAKKIFETLISSSCDAIAHGSMSTNEMWYFTRSYIDLCLGIQDFSAFNKKLFSRDEIISLLVSVICKEKYTHISCDSIKPTCVLRATSNFKNVLEQELQLMLTENLEMCSCINPCAYSALDCAKCFVYFQYFIQGIDAAMQIFKNLIKHLETNIKETCKRHILVQVNVLQADVLNFHTWNTTASIKPLQSFLQTTVSNYPNSCSLLHYLIKLKSASSVVSPTRRFFARILTVSNKLTPNVWIFVLASELSILYSIIDQQRTTADQTGGLVDASFCQGINWKIRALYERALKSPMYCYIPLLWRSYIKFEISNNEVEKARSIYHRAMQNCSWSKNLLMDGIEYFRDDLKQIIDFMVEKQMRIFTPLEEITLLMEHCVQD